MSAALTETEQAILFANEVLDRPLSDPDDDVAVLARQYLRLREKLETVRRSAEKMLGGQG